MAGQISENEPLLTLKNAAERLGVHPATLRRWADRGEIAVRLTAGGHRRFPKSEVDRLSRSSGRAEGVESERHPGAVSVPAGVADQTARTITSTRSEIQHHYDAEWITKLDEQEREEKRMLGRRLVGLMMQYLARDDGDGDELLAEGRAIGRLYARTSLQSGLELSEALKATMFFRDHIVESAVVLPEASRGRPDASARVYRRINTFLNSVQLAIAEVYDAKRTAEDDPA